LKQLVVKFSVLQKKEKKRTFLGIHVENEYRKVRLCAPYLVSSLIFVQSHWWSCRLLGFN